MATRGGAGGAAGPSPSKRTKLSGPDAEAQFDAATMDRISRMYAVYGGEAIAKIITMRVLVVGLKGVGVEAAKNLALAGPKAITLVDNDAVETRHLGANFFLKPGDVGSGVSVAEAVMPRLKELNKAVMLDVQPAVTDDLLKEVDAVVVTQGNKADLVRWNEVARTNGTAFVSCLTFGLSALVFSDFGDSHTIVDCNGVPPVSCSVTNITADEKGVVTLLASNEGGKMHGLQESDHDGWVTISEVEGMYAKDVAAAEKHGHSINEAGPFKYRPHFSMRWRNGKRVKSMDAYALEIGDTRDFSDYVAGGTITQVKMPVVKHYRSLAANFLQPVAPGEYSLATSDFGKFGRSEQLHFAFNAVLDFEVENGRRPALGSDEDVADCFARAKLFNESCKALNKSATVQIALEVEEIEEAVISMVAAHSSVEVQPVACFFGGIVAQEIVKLTGKYTPINQWLHFDFFEALPDTLPSDTAPIGSRHDDHIAIWGKEFQDKLGAASTFLVGCGALGCELLKNFALMGVACGGGTISTTDNDRIEVSNLNRQFLFRETNVGQPKSLASAVAARDMNPAVNIEPHETLVHPGTEDKFNDAFWRAQTFVTNALDNIKARQYVDGRIVFFGLPLLESGTLGTSGNSLPIVPHITASYTDGAVPADDENEIPMCTLRNFPSLIDHCIEWSRAQFEDMFVSDPATVSTFLQDSKAFLDDLEADVKSGSAQKLVAALKTLRSTKATIQGAEGATFEKCVEMAYSAFHAMFRDKILALIAAFPADFTKDGEKFWSGAKRFPTAATLDLDDEVHLDFIRSTANIYATNFGIVPLPSDDTMVAADDPKRDAATFKRLLAGREAPPVQLSAASEAKLDVAAADKGEGAEEAKAGDADAKDLEEAESLLAELRALNPRDVKILPADFEKDADMNFHIDFIASAANLRARNYKIAEATRHKCKMIAGKIVPAIATTTASMTGLVCLELIKILQNKPLDSYKESSNNLGVNSYFFSTPAEPRKAPAEVERFRKDWDDDGNEVQVPYKVFSRPVGFTKWDKTEITGENLTVKHFMEKFSEVTEGLQIFEMQIKVEEGAKGFGHTVVFDGDADNPDALLTKECIDIYGADVARNGYILLDVNAVDSDEQEYDVPRVIYRFS